MSQRATKSISTTNMRISKSQQTYCQMWICNTFSCFRRSLQGCAKKGSRLATAKRTAGGARRGRGSGAVREFPTTPHLLIPPLLLSMLTHSGAGSKRFLSVGLNERKDETID